MGKADSARKRGIASKLLSSAKRHAPSSVKALRKEYKCFGADMFRYRAFKKTIGLENYDYQQADYFKERVTEQGYGRFRDYQRFVMGNSDELQALKQRLTYQGSHFFRGDSWDVLGETCIPELAARGKVRVWCAGCSQGQEVYSVLMMLLDHMPLEKIELLATDYNDEMLARTRDGRYASKQYGEIPKVYRHYATLGDSSLWMRRELGDAIATRNLNLLTDEYPEGFDLAICRNVIKFFKPRIARDVQRKLARSVRPGGFLFLANEETGREKLKDNPKKLGLQRIGDSSLYRRI